MPPPHGADGKLYVPMFDGKVSVVKDIGSGGQILSQIDLGSSCLAAPAVAHGRILIPIQKEIVLFWKGYKSKAFPEQ